MRRKQGKNSALNRSKKWVNVDDHERGLIRNERKKGVVGYAFFE